MQAIACCLAFDWQLKRRAASRADWTAGNNSPTSTPMMAITTRSSMSVKPCRGRKEGVASFKA